MAIDQALIDEIVRRVVAVSQPERIILFGSAATGEMTGDSDVDLLILKGAVRDRRDEYLRIRQALRGLGCPFDIILMDVEHFEESKDVIGGIAHPASRYGKAIYEAA